MLKAENPQLYPEPVGELVSLFKEAAKYPIDVMYDYLTNKNDINKKAELEQVVKKNKIVRIHLEFMKKIIERNDIQTFEQYSNFIFDDTPRP